MSTSGRQSTLTGDPLYPNPWQEAVRQGIPNIINGVTSDVANLEAAMLGWEYELLLHGVDVDFLPDTDVDLQEST